jgi:hypothetical protein
MLILTADEFLLKGLELGGFDIRRQGRVSQKTNLERFKGLYGSNPIVYAQMWEDLQTTDIAESRLKANELCVTRFLCSINFLKCYQSESERAGKFKICEKTARKWTWIYLKKIQGLKKAKVIKARPLLRLQLVMILKRMALTYFSSFMYLFLLDCLARVVGRQRSKCPRSSTYN